ncbi:hypothetical protein [Brevibacillus sp. 179-C9.3 HS]|uniref:hypothetical protein n=1 Tax=unclassified Brevibacillus TaxID=2684853 RepID=UPI0039A2F5DD
MTMVIAYTWQDKIIMMADSRESRKDSEGKIVEFNDDQTKLIPVNKKVVIGNAGLRKVYLGQGQYYDLNNITQYFVEKNEQLILMRPGKESLKALVDMWNKTLSENLGRDPYIPANSYCFLLAKWEHNEEGFLVPHINTYQSHFNEFQYGGKYAVVGDDAVYRIIEPFFDTNTDDWTFEEVLDHYKKGYVEVMKKVDSVGGPIDVYVLEANSYGSHWYNRKIKKPE